MSRVVLRERERGIGLQCVRGSRPNTTTTTEVTPLELEVMEGIVRGVINKVQSARVRATVLGNFSLGAEGEKKWVLKSRIALDEA